jgi:hypothetical protein
MHEIVIAHLPKAAPPSILQTAIIRFNIDSFWTTPPPNKSSQQNRYTYPWPHGQISKERGTIQHEVLPRSTDF